MFDEKNCLFQKGDLVKAIPYYWEYQSKENTFDTLVLNRQDTPYDDIGVVTEAHPTYGGQTYSVYWQKLQKDHLMSERCLKKITR